MSPKCITPRGAWEWYHVRCPKDYQRMIIDSHAYCFEPADSPRGYASGEEHLRWVQKAQAGHHQPAFRLRDRVEGPSDVLDPNKADLDDLPDVNFRIDKAAGRVLWDYQGETYTKHFYPPNLRNLEFTPDSMIGEMDYAGIDKVLLHTNAMLGRSNEYQAECIQKYPDRILSMALLDERQIHTDVDGVIEGVTTAIQRPRPARDQVRLGRVHRQRRAVGRRAIRSLWEAVSTLGAPVFFTLSTGPARASEARPDAYGRENYIGELRILSRLMERYPDMLCSITHGFPWRVYLDGDRISPAGRDMGAVREPEPEPGGVLPRPHRRHL